MTRGGVELRDDERVRRRMTRGWLRSRGCQDPWFGANIVVVGDLMQLGAPKGDPLYASERLWGEVFRDRTLFLEECMRTSDDMLLRVSDFVRTCTTTTPSLEHIALIRSRCVESMQQVPLGCTVLSPRFRRAVQFCDEGLRDADTRNAARMERGWGPQEHCIQCEDYVVRQNNVELENCTGMEDPLLLAKKKEVLDRDHTRLQFFRFRVGMIAVVTENGVSVGKKGLPSYEDTEWPHEPARNTNLKRFEKGAIARLLKVNAFLSPEL